MRRSNTEDRQNRNRRAPIDMLSLKKKHYNIKKKQQYSTKKGTAACPRAMTPDEG